MGFAADNNVSISVRLQNVTTELRKIEDLLTSEQGVEPRILTDFRDALNRVRNTAWAVEQYLNLKTTEADSSNVLSVLTGERVRVAYQLCRLVEADLAKDEVPFRKGQLLQLRDATQDLGKQLDKAVGE